jgi:hypothetical protein
MCTDNNIVWVDCYGDLEVQYVGLNRESMGSERSIVCADDNISNLPFVPGSRLPGRVNGHIRLTCLVIQGAINAGVVIMLTF